MTAHEFIAACPGLSYRQLDYWCAQRLLGDHHAQLGSGQWRKFDESDLIVARTLVRLSVALNGEGRGNMGSLALYRQVTGQVRDGAETIVLELGPGIVLAIDVDPAVEETG